MIKNIVFVCSILFVCACQEEITPIIPNNSTQVVSVSSNDNIDITIFNSEFSISFKHYPNETQATRLTAPKGELSYIAICSSDTLTGTFNTPNLFVTCP